MTENTTATDVGTGDDVEAMARAGEFTDPDFPRRRDLMAVGPEPDAAGTGEALTDAERETLGDVVFPLHYADPDLETVVEAVERILADRRAAEGDWPCHDYQAPITCLTTPKPKTLLCDWCRLIPNGDEVQALYGRVVEGDLHRDLVSRLGFGDNITEPMADNDTIVKWFEERSSEASEWVESQFWRDDCYAAGHPDTDDCWEHDPALRLQAALAAEGDLRARIEALADEWKWYEAGDISAALRAALAQPTTDGEATR